MIFAVDKVFSLGITPRAHPEVSLKVYYVTKMTKLSRLCRKKWCVFRW